MTSKCYCPICHQEVRVNRLKENKDHSFIDKEYVLTCNHCQITTIGLSDNVFGLYFDETDKSLSEWKDRFISYENQEAKVREAFELGMKAAREADYKQQEFKFN